MDEGHRVFFNLTDLDIESHSSCSFDYVAVSSWPFWVHKTNLMLTVETFVNLWCNRPMHHSLNQFMDKLLISRSMMVTTSLLHSWVNFVEPPGLLPLRPQGTSSMFVSGQITVRTAKASVPSSQKVSAVFVLGICHGLFHLLPHWLLVDFQHVDPLYQLMMWVGRLHLHAIHTLTHPIRTVAGSYMHRSHVSPLVILGIHNLKVKTKVFVF